jgi:hypothetical protein
LKLSWQINVQKYSWAISCSVNVELQTSISEISSVSIMRVIALILAHLLLMVIVIIELN